MKRMILLVAAAMVMTASFAKNVENYDMSIDMRRLAVTLGLTLEQMEIVNDIHSNFNEKMHTAAKADFEERGELVDKAVTKDVHDMYYILNDKQFKTYMTLLNTTLRNKGLK